MYSNKNLKTMDTFALVLVGIGLWFVVVALRPFSTRSQYMYMLFGFHEPRLLIPPFVEGILFLFMGAVLAVSVARFKKPLTTPKHL